MKNILKNSKGITLVALITTIIVLLILASVATTTGKNVLEKSHLTAFTTELKIMQTHVNQLYQKYRDGETIQIGDESYTGDEILTMRKNSEDSSISTNIENSSLPAYAVAQKVFTSEQSGITDKTGYLYFNKKILKDLNIEGVEGEFFVNISTRSVVSYEGLKYQNKMYYTLEQLPDSLYNVDYNNTNTDIPTIGNVTMEKVSDNKWRITVSDIQYDGYVQKWEVQYKLENAEKWSTSESLSFIVNENGNYKVKVSNGSIESEEVTVEKYIGRLGFNVGDYVEYMAPKRADYQLASEVSGYGSAGEKQIIGQEYRIWRVLNIYNDGSMDLVANVKDSNNPIYFQGALGYNNGVYALNDICDYLYQNEANGITARSINIEDIESNMNETGIAAKNNYINDYINNLEIDANYVENKNITNNTVTYKQPRTYYPDIYRYQIGAGIDTQDVLKKGDYNNVNNKKAISESDIFYKDSIGNYIATTNTRLQADSLTQQNTQYDMTMVASYFKDYQVSNNSSDFYNAFFPSGSVLLASRYSLCGRNVAWFGIWRLGYHTTSGMSIFNSAGGTNSDGYCICPLIHLEKTVNIEKCVGENSESNPHKVNLNNSNGLISGFVDDLGTRATIYLYGNPSKITEGTITITMPDNTTKDITAISNNSEISDESNYATYTVSENGTYNFKATDGSTETTTKIRVSNIEKFKLVDDMNLSYYVQNDTKAYNYKGAAVPAGYYVCEDSNYSVDTGIVITDSINQKGYSTGNEWVWVPVNASVGNSIFYNTDENDTISVDNGSTTETIKYKNYSLLYDFTTNASTKVTTRTQKTEIKPSATSGDREISISTNDSEGEQANLGSIYARVTAKNATPTALASEKAVAEQYITDYNSMVTSVTTYGGFYIGRYEITANGEKAGDSLSGTILGKEWNWYALYNKCMTLNRGNTEASMMYGTLWDATMQWLNKSGYLVGQGSTTSGHGNYKSENVTVTNGSTEIKVKPSGTGRKLQTGETSYTKSNNIYDLSGNCFDWTQELRNDYARVLRGGAYYNKNSDFTYYASRSGHYPTANEIASSSRSQLYIK